MEKNRLKIGFLMGEDSVLPAWEYEILTQLVNSDYATILALIQLDFSPSPSDVRKKRESFAFHVFSHFEKWWFKKSANAFDIVDVSKIKSHEGKIHLRVGKRNGTIEFNDEDLNTIKNHEFDLVYQSSLLDDIGYLNIPAKYGIWRINFGSNQDRANHLPGFWEVMENNPVTGSSLQIVLPSMSTIIAYRSLTRTVPYSVLNNLNSVAWKSSSFVPHRLNELYKLGAESFFAKYERVHSGQATNNPVLSNDSPGNLKMTLMFLKNGSRYMKYKIQSKFARRGVDILFLMQEFDLNNLDFSAFKRISIPKNHFWADPFLVKRDNKYFVFFEDFSYKKNKGKIACMEIDGNGNSSNYTVVLEQPYHLSYPFIFEWNGNYFMIPETSANKTVELYKCIDFPDKWEFLMNLMEDILLVDSTLLHHEGKWWLFGNTRNHQSVSANDQLMIYYSDQLFSKSWIPHPQNPVATDITNCRPAGKIFIMNGKMIRPAQNNSSWQYGYAIKLNEIERLNEVEYREKEIADITPEKYGFLGIHTLNFDKGITVIDAIVN
ncbi:MAG: hypothetical protein C5B59_19185 [Bacteroidetes bacterium]|nr:MAG: hypothetical protein C5B59_19185 [Bacteroidota bacterium]